MKSFCFNVQEIFNFSFYRQLSIAVYTLLSPNHEVKSLLSRDKHSPMKHVLDKLLFYVAKDETPLYIKSLLLQALEFVNSKVHSL